MKFTGYVTSRYNSTRVPLKAVQEVGGKTLVDRCIRCLAAVPEIDDILLYGDCPSIKNYITESDDSYRFVQRPIELSGDNVTFEQILDNALPHLEEAEYIVFMTYTAPFFSSESVKTMIDHIAHANYDSAFAARRYKSFAWFKRQKLNYGDSIPKTQDLEPVLLETSNIYIFSKEHYIKTKQRIGVMPYIHIVDKVESWDIDNMDDLEVARMMADAKNSNSG